MLSHYSKITQFRILPSADFRQYFVDISSTKEVWKNLRSAFQRARRELHIDTSYYFHGGRVGGIKIFVSTIWRKSIVYRSLHWSWDRNNEQNIGASHSLYAYLFFLTSWLVSFIIGSRTCIVIAHKLSPWSYIPQCCVFDHNTWCFISRYSIVTTILERRSLQDALLSCVQNTWAYVNFSLISLVVNEGPLSMGSWIRVLYSVFRMNCYPCFLPAF